MIELLMLIVLTTLSTWIVFVIITLTIADLRTITLEKSIRRHPYARKWRGVTKLRKQLVLTHDTSLADSRTIRFALARFQAAPSLRFVEMLPAIRTPQTTRQVFTTYRIFMTAPLVRARSVIGIRSRTTLWPTLLQPDITMSRREQWCIAITWLIALANISFIVGVIYLAILGQSEYLLIYIATVSLWLAWSICSYPHMAFHKKSIFLALLPAAFGYLLWRAVLLLFIPLQLLWRVAAHRFAVLS